MSDANYSAAVQHACGLLDEVKDRFSPEGSDRYVQRWYATWPRFHFDPATLQKLVDDAVPDFEKKSNEPFNVEDLAAHGMLCQIAATWIETGNPLLPTEGPQALPDHLRVYIAATLRGEIHVKRKGGRVRLLGRDLTITQIVDDVAERHKLARYGSLNMQSASHAVADALHQVGLADLSAERTAEIYRRHRTFLRKP